MRIVSVAEMRAIEKKSFEQYLLDERLVIENVGIQGAAIFYQEMIQKDKISAFIFLIGKGNNGADGLAISRNLSNKYGISVVVFLTFPESECSGELKHQLKMAQSFGVRVESLVNSQDFASYYAQLNGKVILVDAMFGSGVRLPLPQKIYDLISLVNNLEVPVIAIDIPSGVEGDTGKIMGNAIAAHWTLAIGAPKLGCFLADGVEHAGELLLLDAGFPVELFQSGDKFQVEFSDVVDLLNKRSKYADKKINGHVLVVGGSLGLTGALILATQAALKVGTGLVTAATWEEQHLEYLSRQIPEIMSCIISQDENSWDEFIASMAKYDTVVIGPGLGRSDKVRRLVLKILSDFKGPVVIDADAIFALSLKEDLSLLSNRNYPTIFTPHAGEFARLKDLSKQQTHAQAFLYLQELIHQTAATVILKGPCTLIGFASGKYYFNFSPNEGMATGGTGDVLAGILGGLLAQEFARSKILQSGNHTESIDDWAEIHRTVLLSILIHSRSGHFAKNNLGARAMSASSLIAALPQAFEEIDKMI